MRFQTISIISRYSSSLPFSLGAYSGRSSLLSNLIKVEPQEMPLVETDSIIILSSSSSSIATA